MNPVLLAFIILFIGSYAENVTDIIGSWESKDASGNVGGISFKKDGTFVNYQNKKAVSTGQYTYSNDTLSVWENNVCTNAQGAKMKGVYRLNFFVKDSFIVEVVSDSCNGRAKGVSGARLGRVKIKK